MRHLMLRRKYKMKYKLNNDIFQSIFGVPSAVADNHLKLASHSALKVILFIMRNGAGAVDDGTTFKLGITRTELDEALLYWRQAGILCDAEASDGQNQADKAPAPSAESGEKAVIKSEKPDRAETARRIGESREIAQVLRRAEQVFGRTLKQSEMSVIVYVMDSLMLTPPVTLMLIQYAAAEGRLSASFIESTAVRWVNEGLTSVREVEKEIQAAQERRSAWGVVRAAFGIDGRKPSANEERAAYRWVSEWGFGTDMLRLAYDACIDHSGKLSVPYINKVLEAWHKNGVNTPQQVKDAEQKRTESKAEKSDSESAPSFDISLYEQLISGKEQP